MGDSAKAGLRQMMPSVFNGIATAIAAVAGLIGLLHQTGYLGNHPRMRAGLEAKARAHPRMFDQTNQLAAASAPAAAASGDAIATAPPMHRNLSGAWRDMASNCHLIKQTGRELSVSSYAAETGKLRSVGTGTVKGRAISVRLNSENPASAEVDLILSDDGRELSGMIKGAKGAHISKWRFVGPSCLQTASRPD
jgi:hypothetical protein